MRRERLHGGVGVVARLLDGARVDDEADAVDGDRGLGDVGCDDALAHAVGRKVEDALLLVDGQRRVQRQHDPPPRRGGVRAQRLDEPLDLLDARDEGEAVAALVRRVLRVDALQHLQEQLRPEQLPRAARQHPPAVRRRLAATGWLVGRRLCGPPRLRVGIRRHMDHVDGKEAAGHGDGGSVVEELREESEVDGGGHDDEAQLGPRAEHAAQQPEQHVGVNMALVHLVEDDHVVLAERRIAGQLAQQHALRHEERARLAAASRLEAHLVAYSVAKLALRLDRHAPRQ